MNRQLTSKDLPIIALALGLLVVLGGSGWVASRRGASQQEEQRMTRQMSREMGVPIIDTSQSSEEVSQEQDNQQELASVRTPAQY
jgi:replicative DNA helicase